MQLWKNREAVPFLFSMACNDQLTDSSLRAARRLIARGHGRSTLENLPVEWDGRPIPWYTYPSLDFLEGLDTSGWSVVEFGSGQNTLY